MAMFKSNVDIDNCSSNSWSFYLLMLIVGTIEMIFSISIFSGVELIKSNQPNRKPYQVQTLIFGLALLLELIYWLVTRIVLANLYLKTYGKHGRHCLTKSFIILC